MTLCPHPKLARGPKAVKVPVPLEHDEQVAFVNWFHLQFPKVLIYAIPNGAHLAGTAKQRAAKMAKLKAEGLVEGMPDLHVPEWRVWIEMKRQKGGRLDSAQVDMIAHLRALGDIVIVGKGWFGAKDELLTAMDAWT